MKMSTQHGRLLLLSHPHSWQSRHRRRPLTLPPSDSSPRSGITRRRRRHLHDSKHAFGHLWPMSLIVLAFTSVCEAPTTWAVAERMPLNDVSPTSSHR
jgi:hypothetical protein